jgi:hypothetical protein
MWGLGTRPSAPPAGSAEGDDGFAAVAGDHSVGDGPGAAEQGQSAGHAADGPGVVAHVDEPEVAVGHGALLGAMRVFVFVPGELGGLGLGGLDEAEQSGRLAVFAGAVGFDKAAVGGLTAAVLLDLALEL